MHQTLLTLAIIGYVVATGLALAYLVQREELLHRLASLATLAAWVLHTGALLALAIELGRPPLASLPEALSVAVWVVVVLEMWLERRYGLSVLGAFVLPVALAFSLQSTPMRPLIGQTLSGAWVWVHIGLALVGIAALVFNFAGALMYLLQEQVHQRPGEIEHEGRDAHESQPDVYPDPGATERLADQRPHRCRLQAERERHRQDEGAENRKAVPALEPHL